MQAVIGPDYYFYYDFYYSTSHGMELCTGAVGDLDGPLSPDQKGFASLAQILSGETAEDRQKWRNEVLNTSAEDFAEFANRLKALKDTASVAVFGSQQSIEQANKELPDTKKLLVEQAILGGQ